MAVPRQAEVRDEGEDVAESDGFAWELVEGVWRATAELDDIIARFARNWRLERVGRVELTLLRLAVYEMLDRPDVPAKVALNEALELERQYGEKSRALLSTAFLTPWSRLWIKASCGARQTDLVTAKLFDFLK